MKTPREILFQRHEAAGPKLDAIRHEIVASHCAPARRAPAVRVASLPVRLWRELFWPCRRIWTGLAAVWLVLAIVNFSQRDNGNPRFAQSQPSAQMMMAWHNQEEMMNELLADRAQPVEALPPRNYEPKPRSEISGITEV